MLVDRHIGSVLEKQLTALNLTYVAPSIRSGAYHLPQPASVENSECGVNQDEFPVFRMQFEFLLPIKVFRVTDEAFPRVSK